jgi:hypothetical protein
MSRTFTTTLSIQVKSKGGSPTVNKKYTLQARDELDLMTQAVHWTGLQEDFISVNRAALTGDAQFAARAAGPATLTIKIESNSNSNEAWFDSTVVYPNMTDQDIHNARAVINARLAHLGIAP